ncbi:unnamed protein product, partial [Meganyctiphanes norvegica]
MAVSKSHSVPGIEFIQNNQKQDIVEGNNSTSIKQLDIFKNENKSSFSLIEKELMASPIQNYSKISSKLYQNSSPSNSPEIDMNMSQSSPSRMSFEDLLKDDEYRNCKKPHKDFAKFECENLCQCDQCKNSIESMDEDLLSYIASSEDPLPAREKDLTYSFDEIMSRQNNEWKDITENISLSSVTSNTPHKPDLVLPSVTSKYISLLNHSSSEIRKQTTASTTLTGDAIRTPTELVSTDAASELSQGIFFDSNAQMNGDSASQVPKLIPFSKLSTYSYTQSESDGKVPTFDISEVNNTKTSKHFNADEILKKFSSYVSSRTSKTLNHSIVPFQSNVKSKDEASILHNRDKKLVNNISEVSKNSSQLQIRHTVNLKNSHPKQPLVYMKLKSSNQVIPALVKNNKDKISLSKKNDTSIYKANTIGNSQNDKNEIETLLIKKPVPIILNQPNDITPSCSSGNIKTIPLKNANNRSMMNLFPSPFLVHDNLKSSHLLGKVHSNLETHFTESIACEDCGREWHAVFVNTAVNLFCPNL